MLYPGATRGISRWWYGIPACGSLGSSPVIQALPPCPLSAGLHDRRLLRLGQVLVRRLGHNRMVTCVADYTPVRRPLSSAASSTLCATD